MRIIAIRLLLATLPCLCMAEMDEAYKQAIIHGALAKVVLRIVDDEGAAVSNTPVHIWFSSYARHQDDADWFVDTDTNGVVTASHRTNEELSWLVEKNGYYQAHGNILFRDRKMNGPKVIDSKWQPYGETRTVVLKRIRNPIEMAKPPSRINEAVALGEWHGYDLVCCDWTIPHGRGQHADVLVRQGLEAINDTSDFRATMDLCFTNNLYSGVCRMAKDQDSEMKSVYTADTNAVYDTTMSFLYEKHPHKPIIDTRLAEDEYLVFRIRTKVDDSGKLISAHYGKIYGPWSYFGKMMAGAVYFNPTPNDTNLEDAETARRSMLRYRQSRKFEQRRKAQEK